MNVKLSEIVRRTGLSLRYWQGRAARGALPRAPINTAAYELVSCIITEALRATQATQPGSSPEQSGSQLPPAPSEPILPR